MMTRNYRDYSYFENRPDIVKIWDDIAAYHDWCRLELREFNPAELYQKESANYGAYLASRRPRRPYLGTKPKWDSRPRTDQRFSR